MKAAQLLYMLVWQAEEELTMHAEKVFDSLAVAVTDEAAAVAVLGRRAADVLGFMLRPRTWGPLLLTRLQEAASGGAVTANLILLAGAVGGAERHALRPCLEDVAFCLAADAVCRNLAEGQQTAVLACTDRLLAVSQEDCCDSVAEHLFKTVVTVLAAAAREAIREAARGQLKQLAALCFSSDPEENRIELLYRAHMGRLLKEVAGSAAGWSAYAYDRLIFEALLHESGPAIGHFTEIVVDVFKMAVGGDDRAEPECRLRLFILLAKLLLNLGSTLDSQGQFRSCLASLIDEVIYPALRWQGGRTALAIRAAATSALLSVVVAVQSDSPAIASVAAKVDSRLIGLFRDDCNKTRKMALQAMGRILQSLSNNNYDNSGPDVDISKSGLADTQLLGSLATELKGRLEDEVEAVTKEAISCALLYLNFLKEEDDSDSDTSTGRLLDSLVLHMDNDNPEVRQLILNGLGDKLEPGWLKARLLPKAIKAVEVHCHKAEAQQLVSCLSSQEQGGVEE